MAITPLFLFVCFAGTSPAQDGSIEQKRNTLLNIRNERTETASRSAIPFLSDTSEIVRAAAASAVIYLPAAEASRLLLPLLSDRSEFVRREAAFALGENGGRTSTQELLSVLTKDKSSMVRSAAAGALGKIGDDSAVGALIAILKRKPSEEDEFLRRSAARSIGQIAEVVRQTSQPSIVPQGVSTGSSAKTMLADMPAAASEQFRSALTTLLYVASNAKEADDTRREAAFAMGSIGDRSAAAFLTANISNKDTYLAQICREALLKIAKLQ